jgi:hypothetical protein
MCLSFDPRIGSNRHEFKTPLFAFLRVQCVNIDPRMFHALSRLGSVSVGIHIQDYAAGGSLLSSQERSGRAECLHRYSFCPEQIFDGFPNREVIIHDADRGFGSVHPVFFCGLVANNRSRERNPQFRRVAIDSGKFAFSLRFQLRSVNLGFSIPAPGLLLSQEILR